MVDNRFWINVSLQAPLAGKVYWHAELATQSRRIPGQLDEQCTTLTAFVKSLKESRLSNIYQTLLRRCLVWFGRCPERYPLETLPPEVTPVDRLGSGLRPVGPIGSGVLVSASFQIVALRILLHSAKGFSLGVICGGGGVVSRGVIFRNRSGMTFDRKYRKEAG